MGAIEYSRTAPTQNAFEYRTNINSVVYLGFQIWDPYCITIQVHDRLTNMLLILIMSVVEKSVYEMSVVETYRWWERRGIPRLNPESWTWNGKDQRRPIRRPGIPCRPLQCKSRIGSHSAKLLSGSGSEHCRCQRTQGTWKSWEVDSSQFYSEILAN